MQERDLFPVLVAVILGTGIGGGYMLGANLREIAGL